MNEVSRRASGEQPATIGPVDRGSKEFDRHMAEARRHATLDAVDREPTRLRSLKRLVLRLARVFTHQQIAYNSQIVDALIDIDRRLRLVQHDLDNRVAITRAALTSLELAVSGVSDVQTSTHDGITSLGAEMEALREAIESLEAADRSHRAEIDMLRVSAPAAVDRPDSSPSVGVPDSALAGFYSDLEEAFRGTRDDVAARLKHYIADVESVKGLGKPVLDVGCGRGEWLELLASYDLPAYGVDINEVFARRNHERGLDVVVGDAVAHLEGLEPGSLAAVSAFHLVEHLPLGALVALIDGALRALAVGGLLIFETPNPTNVIVGSSSFWLDPTHRQPIPPQLLSFMVANRGFSDVDVRFLNPPDEPPFQLGDGKSAANERLAETLNWAFLGPLDYAVVARKR